MRGVPGRYLRPAHGHDLRPALTASLSAFSALRDGDTDADIETRLAGPGVRPVRAGRLLVPKVPNPAIRTSSPFARASPALIAETDLVAELLQTSHPMLRAAARHHRDQARYAVVQEAIR